MMKTTKLFGTTFVVLAGIATASPLYAHKAPKPSAGTMMQGGGMDGMMGMMSMMEQMNKMMGLCNKMMEASMQGTGDHNMNQPMTPPAEPEKKS